MGMVTGDRATGRIETMPVLRPGHDSVAEVGTVVFSAQGRPATRCPPTARVAHEGLARLG